MVSLALYGDPGVCYRSAVIRRGLLILSLVLGALLLSCASRRVLPKTGTDPLLRERPDNTPVDDEAPLGKLPEDVIPLEYDLNLTVDPSKETFSGFAAIGVRLTRPRSHMWLHGMGLQVKQAQVTLADGSTRRVSYQQLTPSGVVRLSFRSELEPQKIRLVIGYDAEIGTSLEGLYRVEDDGRAYVFTQLEATHARRVFPCFDEPRFKTPFRLTLTVPAEMEAISTTSVEAQRLSSDGSVRTLAFRETEKLPTYLLALAVGRFDVVEAEIPPNRLRERSVPLRGVAVAGKGERLLHALETTGALLEALETYVALPYPYEKIDVVAVPDFSGGAMENVGVITFAERLLLLDPKRASAEERFSLERVMAHELAHQWFGNLVTHRWWNDLWLNESFATWMAARVLSEWHPELGAERHLMRSAQRAMGSDSLASARAVREPVWSFQDIEGAFDALTYHKGGALLSMFEAYLGEERFQAAVRAYLGRFPHGTATAEDFIEALAAESDEQVAAAFFGFLTQPGVPTLAGRLLCEGEVGRFDLRQSRYVPLGSRVSADAQWDIPLCIETSAAGERKTTCRLMTARELSFELDRCPDWVMPNAGGRGYFRFTLEDASWRAVLDAARAGVLTVRGRMALVDALHASADAGELPLPAFFDAIKTLSGDPDRHVLELLIGAIREARLQWVGMRGGVERYARTTLGPRARAVGLEGKVGEAPELQRLRAVLHEAMVFVARDPRIRKEASARGLALIGKEHVTVTATTSELAATWLGAAVQLGGGEVIDRLVAILEGSSNASERRLILEALGRVEEPELTERVRELAISDILRDDERLRLLLDLSREVLTARGTWLWLRTNFRALVKRLPSTHVGRTPFVARRLCSEADLASIDEFFSGQIERFPAGARQLSSTLERVELCIAKTRALEGPAEGYFGPDEVALR